jgi:hypothetical protein
MEIKKQIIKYKKFSASLEFEDWQKENPRINIHQCMPVVNAFECDSYETSNKVTNTKTDVGFGIFVLYSEIDE